MFSLSLSKFAPQSIENNENYKCSHSNLNIESNPRKAKKQNKTKANENSTVSETVRNSMAIFKHMALECAVGHIHSNRSLSKFNWKTEIART